MMFAVDITTETSANTALVAMTVIGDRAALDIRWKSKPTEGEIEACNAAIETFMDEALGMDGILLESACEADPRKRQELVRKFLGGGQG